MNQLDLNGEWRLAWSDGQRNQYPDPAGADADLSGAFAARVPGEVHLDLLRAGVIPDPYAGAGALASRWVEEYLWYYSRTFDAGEVRGRAWLVFEQLDYGAAVHLNGELVGRHANAFRPCRIEVTGRLRAGENLVTVEVESGLLDAADKPASGYAKHRDVPWNKRHWLRKPQSQFLWDWSTRFINVGISGDVRLEWTEAQVRLDQVAVVVDTAEDLRSGRVVARLFVEALAGQPTPCTASLEVAGHGTAAVAFTAEPGISCYEVELTVQDPALWWPINLGAPTLHTARVTLGAAGATVAAVERRIGFRHVRFDQSPNPGGGSNFILVVNGRRVFCKGGNLVPADMIFQRIDRDRYTTLVDRAVEANFNFLRVWGGGLYEAEALYDICDERGILVWQEFIYACSRYPTHDQAFFDEVVREARHQVRRLAHRASLVAWCGNNENEWGAWDWGFDRGVVHPDHAFFHLVLPRLLHEEDPAHYYQPSSPWSPDGSHPNRDEVGDQHPWTIGFHNGDFRGYRTMTCRFPNEGGIQGPTALPTMRQCLEGGPQATGSFAWRLHDNTNGPHADAQLRLWTGLDPAGLSVEEYTYWGGLVHGEGLREYCENFRRRMFDSACAAFWMYNDCWPATRSWTIVDYNLRRTPAFAPVRRALAPVAVVVAQDADTVRVFGVNDTDTPVRGRLRYGVLRLDGAHALDSTVDAELAANASTPLAEFPLAEWTSPAESVAFALLDDGERVLSRGRLILPLFKEMAWPEPRLRVRLDGGDAVFESDTFVWGVCIDLDGETALDDNFFDVWPGLPHRVRWHRTEPPRVLFTGNAIGRVPVTG